MTYQYPNRSVFPTECDGCGIALDTESFRGKGLKSESQPHGHLDPRHDNNVVCVECFGTLKGSTLYDYAEGGDN